MLRPSKDVTPHLDALAARGTRFANAYTNSPICMPAQAALATGRYTHQIGCWDNAHAYPGAIDSWHHRLRAQGHRVDSIGKLDFREGDDHGFSETHFPLYRKGPGDIGSCAREAMEKRTLRIDFDAAGPGDSSHLRYGRRNVDLSCEWIGARTRDDATKPWALFLGIGSPHPLTLSPPPPGPNFTYTKMPHGPLQFAEQLYAVNGPYGECGQATIVSGEFRRELEAAHRAGITGGYLGFWIVFVAVYAAGH